MKIFGILATVLACVVATSGCDDESGLRRASAGIVSVNPGRFVFPKVEVGTTVDQRVEVENIGEGTLKLVDIVGNFSAEFELFYTPPGDDRELVGIDPSGNHMPNIDVEPGEALILILSYSPSGGDDPAGAIKMRSNDPGESDVVIPIVGAGTSPEITVSPRTVEFGRVPANSAQTETVMVSNLGQEALTINAMRLSGSQDFSITIGEQDPVAEPSVLGDPDGDGSPGLAPGGSVEVTVHYLTEVQGPDSGELIIDSNDPNAPAFVVNLTANGASPCIQISPEQVEFPSALVGRENKRPLSIQSCGGEPLEIQAIRLVEDGGGVYSLDAETIPELPVRLAAYDPSLGEAAPARNINIVFNPEDESAYGGKLIIESNDPVFPSIEVPIVGRGTLNECPVADVVNPDLEVLPLDIVTLDGSPSVDADGPGGRPVRYEWTVVSRPDGSTAQPVERFLNPASPADGGAPDDTSTPTAVFFVDLAGDYTLSLRVTDNLDLSAPSADCDQPDALVQIHATPNQDIHVQLVWDTPGDPDQTDGEGSDVDMHMLHPNGRAWMIAPLDCYYANVSPDWGPAGPDGNPSLDIDDTNGAGPENINLEAPENTVRNTEFLAEVGV